MFESSQSDAVNSPVIRSDQLVDDLIEMLPSLADEVMVNDKDIKAAIEKAELSPRHVRDQGMERADEVMRSTNHEIWSIRDARNSQLQ
jgi:hypothetical protein